MELQKKDKIQIGIITALVVVLVFVLGGIGRQGKRGRSHGKGAVFPIVQPIALEENRNQGAIGTLKEETKKMRVSRDPFSRQGVSAVTARGLSLSGIAWDQEDPTAIIDSRIVRVGDEIGGYVVTEIRKDTVVLNNGTENLELKLEIEGQ